MSTSGVSALRAELAAGRLTAEAAVASAYDRLAALGDDAVVISLVPPELALARARGLGAADPDTLPLLGMPFAVKDNIDVAGMPTTAGCPAWARVPERSATVVRRLEAAGAVVVAKTNLDQFACGLVGTRSPYGTPRNPFDATRVPGGSSSGSAVAVARGAVPFALGTDTAGSGRVPAAFCGIAGLKPTPGWLSNAGVVPAVRSIDCVSVLALTVPDGWQVLQIAAGFDPEDAYSRRPPAPPGGALDHVRVGIGDEVGLGGAERGLGLAGLAAGVTTVDLAPFLEAGRLLYGGPWVAERWAVLGAFIEAHPTEIDPTVHSIVSGGAAWSAADLALGTYELAALRRRVDAVWADVDVLVLPTAPPPPTLAEVAADPIGVNAGLGRFTTFANLLGLCAVAVPTGMAGGLPTGVTVLGPAWADATVAAVAARIHAAAGGPCGTTDAVPPHGWAPAGAVSTVELVVVGAHLRGMPLHHQLEGLGATFSTATRTAPTYRLYALPATAPPKPGLVRVASGGVAIEVEVYRLGMEAFGRFVAAVAPPLCIGTVELEGGRAAGFLCEPAALPGARDISTYGGWRAYLDAEGAPSRA